MKTPSKRFSWHCPLRCLLRKYRYFKCLTMLFRRPSAVSIAVVVFSLSVCILFIKHLKGVYEDNQKFKRLQDYKKYMNEVLEYMGNVESIANKSSEYYHTLSRHLPPLSKGN